ncbi:hypothetical protein [Cytophaga hutchinsonii]|uniref:Uncharacterized protein n=1 Tax=Cytophaga hutchinsonii (strain ATCC 33406 / DSM 1761 / CIP 103989 / NBRC 15051 / NCIMB 9469 / D465) TaxID=269798 RepID=A0A6N4SX74_CYTH3|nr:hypothetical protein [Cytophaga hutchinsonii]ABG61018.1 hypothetical protein CHU_3786 [Cytophaga hutchinsonii ATCC 33406]SFX44460.1 hypothetical protein SAMN04487930_104134 [Cytophaga hutchinsonii ATCC 33406]
MPTLWKKEDIRLKIKYYLIPQALVSLFITLYPFFIGNFFRQAYVITNWELLNQNIVFQTIFIITGTLVIAYFAYAKTGIFLFDFYQKKWGQRSSFFILPLFIGAICSFAIHTHIDHAKIRSYSITSINELRNIHDSTEVYTIGYYNILYDEYFYTERIEDVNIGTSKHHQYVTEVNTYAVCPVLVNFSTEYDLKKQKVWIGFNVCKRFNFRHNYQDPLIKDAAYENLTKIHSQKDVTYFTETSNKIYADLIKEKLSNNSIPYTDPIILEAHYEPYVPYDGYAYALSALYFYLGANAFLTIVAMTKYVDQSKKEKRIK